MVLYTVVSICLLGLVTYCHGHSFKFQGCPKVQVMKEFDLNEFTGVWYAVARFSPIATCAAIKIQKSPEGFFTMQENSKMFGLSYGSSNAPREGRKMKVISEGTDSIFKVQRSLFSIRPRMYGVVATDYSNYAITWSCDPLVIGSVRNLDILSRSPDVDMTFIKEATEKATAAGIDVRPLETVDHSKCNDEEATSKKNNINNMFYE